MYICMYIYKWHWYTECMYVRMYVCANTVARRKSNLNKRKNINRTYIHTYIHTCKQKIFFLFVFFYFSSPNLSRGNTLSSGVPTMESEEKHPNCLESRLTAALSPRTQTRSPLSVCCPTHTYTHTKKTALKNKKHSSNYITY